MTSPQGFLGVRFGDDAVAAAARLGLVCPSWSPWEGDPDVQACFDAQHPIATLGRSALVRLFQVDGRVVGLSLRFRHAGADRDALRAAVRKEWKLAGAAGEDPYHVWEDGSVVHLGYDDSDDTCTLTVAGARMGKPFAAYLLRGGMGGLLRVPH
jgi:hypothetical protein